ncbi:MAG: hypothetical protein GY926_01660 [bacterium]|nr:hypothetical protein [bacterium]MCP4963922.1 hypothetical protein [bacterium]
MFGRYLVLTTSRIVMLLVSQADCSYARFMPSPTACLIDVYETVLSCDFTALATELPAFAGIPTDPWDDAFHELVPAINDGRLCGRRSVAAPDQQRRTARSIHAPFRVR